MSKLSSIEFDVMDELYFVISYHDLLKNVNLKTTEVENALKSLLLKNYINQLEYSKVAGDFIKKDAPDLEALSKFHYLATKEGLLAHNM